MREKAGFFFLSAESDDLHRFTQTVFFFHKCPNNFLFGPPETVGGGRAEGKLAAFPCEFSEIQTILKPI